MKKSLLILWCSLATLTGFGQATATDFTTLDCNQVSHNLFTELNAGKVVVITWVMPCYFCINGANASWQAVQTFDMSNPGKVLYYLVDDFGDNTCNDLSAWITANNVAGGSPPFRFENVGKPINMNDYGSGGMPKVVVVGGPSHYVYFNENFSLAVNQPAIENAIAQGLVGGVPTSVSSLSVNAEFHVQMMDEQLLIQSQQGDELQLFDLSGRLLHKLKLKGTSSQLVNLSSLPKGVFVANILHHGVKKHSAKLVK